MTTAKRQFYALYLARFASGFGLATLLTLLPDYIDLFDPSGFVIGLYTTGLTLAQAVAVVPFAWAGDRHDKRLVLLVSLGLSAATYAAFAFVGSSAGFVATRGLQGIAVTGAGLMSLALVGQLAPADQRANYIGTANAARFAAAIAGTLSAGLLYEAYGFDAVFSVLVSLVTAAFLGVLLFIDPDETTVGGFPFTDLALNRRILTITSFRAQYALSVTLIRTWVPIYAGVSAARGGLAYSAVAVSVVITAEKFTNMVCQPFTGRLSDRIGRAWFVFVGGGLYGLVALAVPFSPALGAALPVPASLPLLGALGPAFLPLVALNGLLGVADSLREPASMALFADEGSDNGGIASSFGIRELVWRPGSVLAPMGGGLLMGGVGMQWVFYVGAASAFTGIAAFAGILVYDHGRGAFAEW
ncbi:MFS transporter [Halostella salina]|uniref:MFS transporter n=1 Tax=Halostella salina TaxID=1547897 RepID=UPI000EF82D55|nr:MFS transporter [Halostella salina]